MASRTSGLMHHFADDPPKEGLGKKKKPEIESMSTGTIKSVAWECFGIRFKLWDPGPEKPLNLILVVSVVEENGHADRRKDGQTSRLPYAFFIYTYTNMQKRI